ncbi:chemotaxis response regulator protein-glutamate methylesterase [Paenibacillus sp. MWE-103]|uniref:Protein-glutamate methylesterase/protein-glutamine glutaminase n=1 Tax=Paenibacillus artemisiicola TaxID=1172618 RepID=A0ABS3WEV7_9BACL|nr:chemotaxis response regulator protein-glutamate methylesterase [Paenibacillus artemisiicola]MBO7746636.1 chemotaxis response regulator protein-glutamate methylesterase [Paenibacillus artemisiicola]
MAATSRVLVVDDSAFMRQIICDLIGSDPRFAIAGTANDGRDAIEAVRRLKPDIVTMDLEMPVMNGLEAVERIMRVHPVPIVMMSSVSDDGTRETIKALQNGAFDFIRKPSGPLSPDIRRVGEQLLEKLRIAAITRRHSKWYAADRPGDGARSAPKQPGFSPPRPQAASKPDEGIPAAIGRKPAHAAKTEPAGDEHAARHTVTEPAAEAVKTHPAAGETPEQARRKPQPTEAFRHLVAIGTSTGGPRALHEVISALPEDFPAPVLVVQHMPPKFTRSLAQRLDAFSALHVREAAQGERICAGVVYIAPGGHHLTLAKDGGGYRVLLTDDAPRGGHRPSVDALFESCARFPELKRHAVLMTGMGTDGAKGMQHLNESGAETAIAESEESCVVYGMPRAAVEAGAAKDVLPLKDIAPTLVRAVRR